GKWGNYVCDIHLEREDHHVIKVVPRTISTAAMPEEPEDKAVIQGYYDEGKRLLSERKVANLPEKFADDKVAAVQVSLDAIADFAKTDLAILSSGLFLTPFKSGII